MILKESRELEWIQQLRIRYPYTNPTLIEKAIRAFSLLEALAVSGCPFVFKGGTALMLHMNSAKRISIDVDIICEPGTNVIGYLNKTALEYGFGEVISGDVEFGFAQGAELYTIFDNLLSSFVVNLKSLYRYADRRARRSLVENIVKTCEP